MQCLIVLSCLCSFLPIISACNFLSVNAYYCHRVHTHLQLNILFIHYVYFLQGLWQFGGGLKK